MAQVTIHLPVDSNRAKASDDKIQLATRILGKHGLSLSGEPVQAFHNVAIPDQETAKSVVAELQSNGITAFLKPATLAPM
jgi:hypothetical protein